MTELIDKKEMMRLFQQMWMSQDTPMEEDLETWGIDADAFKYVAEETCKISLADLSRAPTPNNLRGELLIQFAGGFNLGYLCALEVEMRRQASAD